MKNYYVNKYGPLTGRDWILRLPAEELKAFIEQGLKAADYGRLGGIARARTARRDRRGRFVGEQA